MTEAYEQLKVQNGKRRAWKHRLRRMLGRKDIPKLDVMTDAALLDMCKEGELLTTEAAAGCLNTTLCCSLSHPCSLAGVIPADDVMELQHRYGEGNLRLRDEELGLTPTDKAYRLIQRFQTMQAEEQSAV